MCESSKGRVGSLVSCTMGGLTCVHHILLLCVVVININSCVSCPVPSDFLLFVFLSGRRPALLASLYLVPSRKRRVATHVCRFALCILYLYAEPIVEPLVLLSLYSSCAILQIYVSSALLAIIFVYGVFAGKAESPTALQPHS